MATDADRLTSSMPLGKLAAHRIEQVVSLVVGLSVAAALVWGWNHRAALPFDPENGLGYALGIVGSTMMLVLLGYPLRKRTRPTAHVPGSVGFWFRLHMLLGLFGPLAILFHSRFSWGALNSAVALGTMIVVASSGLMGRYFYARVYRGYSNRKLELHALKQEMQGLLDHFRDEGFPRDDFLHRLQPFEDRAIQAGSAFWTSAGTVVGLSVETRLECRRLSRTLARTGHGGSDAARVLREYFHAVRRAAEFAFFDRLLRLWHLLHLPLFILLVAAAVLHIVAVHMY